MAQFRVFRLKRFEATVDAPDAHSAFEAAHDLRDGWRVESDSISDQVIGLDGVLRHLRTTAADDGSTS